MSHISSSNNLSYIDMQRSPNNIFKHCHACPLSPQIDAFRLSLAFVSIYVVNPYIIICKFKIFIAFSIRV